MPNERTGPFRHELYAEAIKNAIRTNGSQKRPSGKCLQKA